ncbi:MAG: metalloregulator ArsR/SmtB family transcription factor [Sedimenticola sp.]|nr:metalloregulator ArsR/SmtB family transcription factor [Sedimenticola sp.]
MTALPIDLELAAQGFAAVGSESRLQVLRTLVRAGDPGLTIGEIGERLGIPASTLNHHLRFLAAADLIRQEKQGRMVINRANYPGLQALAEFLLHECCADCGPVAAAETRS